MSVVKRVLTVLVIASLCIAVVGCSTDGDTQNEDGIATAENEEESSDVSDEQSDSEDSADENFGTHQAIELSSSEFDSMLVFELDGESFTLPFPVQSLVDRGWYNASSSASNSVDPGKVLIGYWLTPPDNGGEKSSGYIRLGVYNDSEEPVPWQQCDIISVEASDSISSDYSLTICDDIEIGCSYDSVVELYGEPYMGTSFEYAQEQGYSDIGLYWFFEREGAEDSVFLEVNFSTSDKRAKTIELNYGYGVQEL